MQNQRGFLSRDWPGSTDALEKLLRQGDCTGGGCVVQSTHFIGFLSRFQVIMDVLNSKPMN